MAPFSMVYPFFGQRHRLSSFGEPFCLLHEPLSQFPLVKHIILQLALPSHHLQRLYTPLGNSDVMKSLLCPPPPHIATTPPPAELAKKGTEGGCPLISSGSFSLSLQVGISIQLHSLFWNHSRQAGSDVKCTQFTSQAYKLKIPSTVMPEL